MLKKLICAMLFTCTLAQAAPESILQKDLHEEHKASRLPVAVLLYEPNYVLPFNYTNKPFQESGNVPSDQRVENEEVKFQISFMVPVLHRLFRLNHHSVSLNAAYTHLSRSFHSVLNQNAAF